MFLFAVINRRLGGQTPGSSITSPISSIVDSSGQSLYGANTITGFTLDRTQVASGTNGTVGTGGIASPSVATTVPAGVGTSRTVEQWHFQWDRRRRLIFVSAGNRDKHVQCNRIEPRGRSERDQFSFKRVPGSEPGEGVSTPRSTPLIIGAPLL
jgi:hypothetical protein